MCRADWDGLLGKEESKLAQIGSVAFSGIRAEMPFKTEVGDELFDDEVLFRHE
jgi:hypothetical protein